MHRIPRTNIAQRTALTLAATALIATPCFAGIVPSFQGLGDLAGGGFSQAFGVSADGSAVVGLGSSASGFEAFRWTSGGGMVGLGDLAGGSFFSIANGVSADGSVVVGQGLSASGNEAFIWDDANGMQNLQSVLESQLGLDLTGWTLSNASSVSADGLTIVGLGINPDGFSEAFIAVIPGPGALGLLAVTGLFRGGRRRKLS